MTQKTIKALYKQPVNYKLMKDGYKTIKGVINAQDGMPKILDLPTPSELYESDLVYNVDTSVNGAPIITTNSFTLPDDETCESKQYCYATKGTNYNYVEKTPHIHKSLDNTTYSVIGSPTINSAGIASNFYNSSYLVVDKIMPSVTSYEVVIKFKTDSFNDGRLIGNYNTNIHSIQVEVPGNGETVMWWGHPSSSYGWQALNPNYTILTNTWYWVKGIYDSTLSTVTVYIHKENEDWVNCGYINVNGCGWNQGIEIGADQGGAAVSSGTQIDLLECYIKINGDYWWKPWNEYTVIEEDVIQIPGMLDSSVTTDNWQQNQEYKLYQLKNQNNTNTLQLTTNNITDTEQKYKQYVQQLTIPARTYKWYYNGIPEESYPSYYAEGEVVVSNGVASNFGEGSLVEFNVYPRYYIEPIESFTTVIEFETGSSVTDHSLLELVNWHYNSTLDRYTEEMIYFSCIHNGKFSTTNDGTLTTFNDGTTLSPNTKYWMALYLTDENARTYLIPDNNYTPETLPSLSSWTLENTITFSEAMDIYYNEWFFGCYVDMSGESVQYDAFNGKLFVDNMLAFNGLTLDPSNIIWEPYYYYNYIYRWYANKSLYTYSENQNYADTLDFSDSWLNVTSNWKTQKQYINPNVCLMPIDGGETIDGKSHRYLIEYKTDYNINGTIFINDNIATNFQTGSYIYSDKSLINHSSWEFQIKFKITNSSDLYNCLLSTDTSDSFGFDLGIKNNKIIWYISYAGASGNSISNAGQGSAIINNDIWYWVKFGFNGSEYYSKYSIDGIEYLTDYEYTSSTKCKTGSKFNIGVEFRKTTGVFTGSVDLRETKFILDSEDYWEPVLKIVLPGCLYNYTDEGQEHNFDVYYDSNYTQPILISSGQTYSSGTKVDTITIPAHRTWQYTSGGNWSKITYVDTSYSNYTYNDGNLVLTEYTGSDTDVIVPNAVI